LLGQLEQNLAVQGLVRPLEGDDQAEAGRKAHQLLAGVGLVQVVAGAVRKGLLDQVAAVGGGVDGDVVGAASGAALQNGLEGRKVVVVGRKAQIVDEQDEFEGVGGQLVHQVGQEVELVLFHLHQAQALGGVFVGNGLHRAGFAGAGVPVQQHVVGRQARQQGLG